MKLFESHFHQTSEFTEKLIYQVFRLSIVRMLISIFICWRGKDGYYRVIKFIRVSSMSIRICQSYRHIIQLAATRKPLRHGQS